MNHGWAGLAIALLAIMMVFAQFGGNDRAREIITPAGSSALTTQPASAAYTPIENWPPELDAPYPDIPLWTEDNKATTLSSFKGRIVFVIPTYMGVPESQALAGAMVNGRPAGRYESSITAMFQQTMPDIILPHKDIIFVHLLLKNQTGQQASIEDARKWRALIKLPRTQGHYIVVPNGVFPIQMWDDFVPGVFLLDDEFKLRASSVGNRPEHDLKEIVFPMVRVMLDLKAARYDKVIDP